MQRIEIETQMREERQRADHDGERADQDRLAMMVEIVVDRREAGKAGRLALAGRCEQLEQRGQQRERREERDEHPDARDQAELRYAAVRGRQKREEARGDGRRRERERHAHRVRGADERVVEIRIAVPLLAILDAVLDREIDTEADEQHHERDRDHVQRADHHQPERGRDDQADEQRDEHGRDHPLRAQRDPQDHEHDRERRDAVDERAVLDRREFLVGERLLAREPHGGAEALVELERLRGRADRARSLLARLQRAVVDDGLHGDERARGLAGRVGIDERAPRERGRLAGEHVVDGGRAAREQLRHARELDLPRLQRHAERRRQRRREARDARVFREHVDERPRARELRGRRRDVLLGQEQQPVVLEERAARGLRHLADAARVGLAAQALGERVGGGAGEFGRGRLDDGEDRLVALRERVVDRAAERRPFRVVLDELADVGVDLEMVRDIDAAERGDDERQHDDPDRAPHRPGDESDEDGSQHEAAGWGLRKGKVSKYTGARVSESAGFRYA